MSPGEPVFAPRAVARVLAVVNPAAGRGAALRAWDRARPVLEANDLDLQVAETGAPGDAADFAAAAAADGVDVVVAVGGDGTVHEVANGLLRTPHGDGGRRTALAVVPAGSGNDFVKQLGIRPEPESAARLVSAGVVRRVDAGRVGDRFFVNGVGVGFDARVAMEARRIRWLRGTPLYALALLRVLRGYRAQRMRVEVGGREIRHTELTLVTVANGPCCGGGFWLCPDATLDDGILDVLIAERTSRTRILGFLGSALRGTHLGRPEIELEHAQVVTITGDEGLPVHADGEILPPVRTIEIRIVPGALPVVVAHPPDAA